MTNALKNAAPFGPGGRRAGSLHGCAGPVVIAVAALLSGCSFIPTYRQPAAPVAPDWPDSAGAAATAAAAGRSAVETAWQDYFADDRLRRLVASALESNRDLRVAVLNIEQSRAQYGLRRADQLPTLNASLGASRGTVAGVTSAATSASTAGGTTVATSSTGVRQNTVVGYVSAGLAVTAYELDFWGRIASLSEAALAQYLATQEGRRAAQITLIASVANGWLALLADEELLEISRQTVATREESVKLTKLRLDNGVASELDFRQAESLTEAARSALAQQLQRRAQDENALVLLLGAPLPDDIRASLRGSNLATVGIFADIPAGLPSDLLTSRPDIRQAELQLIGANANIGAARAAFFPRISLTASLGSASPELSGLFASGTKTWSVAPSLLLPIFDAGRNQANLDLATTGRDIAVAQYERSIQTAFREVADTLAARATLGEQVRAQQAQANAESIRLKLSDLRYRNGVASYLDFLDAQRSLFAVQQQVVQTRLAQLQNQVLVYKALGGGWSEPAARTTASTRP